MALAINGTTGISGVDGSASAPAIVGSDSNTGFSFASDTISLNTGGTTRATIDSNGRLGLGVTSPASTLHVADGTEPAIRIQDTNNANSDFKIFSPDGANHLRIHHINTSTDYVTLTSGGDLGIGTVNPLHHVVVSVTSTNKLVGQFLNNSTSFGSTVLQAACSRNTTNGSYSHFKCSINGVADKMRVLDSGAIQSTSNSFGGISDESLKENIVDAGSQWDDIKNIRVRKFNFKKLTDPEQKTMLGVVAQEAELVCPNLVESTVQMQEGVEQEYKSFKYSILYMKAIKALQEAQIRIETLETKVAALEAA